MRWLEKIAKKYHEQGFGLKTMIATAAAGLMFVFAASPSKLASLFGGTWPCYVPQAPFQIFAGIAGIGLGYEAFHLYREYKKLKKLTRKN
jgi:hypothetical protein